jgi:RNA polymerase sigma factor (sigma-70 family)
MTNRNSTIAIGKQICTLFDVGALGATPDRGLLDQFARGGETAEAAFATLVERHGTMVLRVCRHLLGDGHLAEDAFQVTFLVLARRARAIHDPDVLAGWLHRVARRVALRARGELRRRNNRERPEPGEIAVTTDSSVERDELCAIVHEEIDRLSDTQRLPIVLCALEGLSHEEAAQRLRWPVGTVKSRLVRGRRRLEGRLARRGLAPALALVAGVAAKPAGAAPVPLALGVSTTRAALQGAAVTARTAGPVSSLVSLLLQKELSTFLLAKVQLMAFLALAACASAALIGMTMTGLTVRRVQEIEPQSPKAPTSQAKTPEPKAPIVPKTGYTNVLTTDAGRPESPPAIPDEARENPIVAAPERRRSALGEHVDRAIHDGVLFLKTQQKSDGSWTEVQKTVNTGTTSLVTLALLSAGETPDSPAVRKALAYLRQFGPDDLRNTYAISLQTQVLAAAEPQRDRLRIAANVDWLERAQIRPGDPVSWPGSWDYSDFKRARNGDNSNTQYALLGLHAAREAGVPVKPEVWVLAQNYWEKTQKNDGSWAYTPDSRVSTASMTCAGISSLIISGLPLFQGQEFLQGELIQNCGEGGVSRSLQGGLDWLASHFMVGQNFGHGQEWKYYYFYALERAGRLSGVRFFGRNDWYRLGAQELVHEENALSGSWRGANQENELVATSFALLFLAKGRAPVLINKLFHRPLGDWNHDPDDVRNLVGIISRDWKSLLTWQVVDPSTATLPELLQAPILFFNGHKAPEFTLPEKKNLREYMDHGGVILAEACCGSPDFDRGFKALMTELFPEKSDPLRPLADDHPIWSARHLLNPNDHPLWGIPHGVRTAVIYSPMDLSCFWNQSERSPANPAVIKAIKLGQNVIDHVTGRKLPPDKLTDPEIRQIKVNAPKRGTLRIARLKHAGDWTIAPQAIPNLMDALRKPPFPFAGVITQKDLFPRDPNLIYYPLITIHGRGAISFPKEDLDALRRHIEPGGGSLLVDAHCGDVVFDASFRRLVGELVPNNRLVPIPRTDELFTKKVGFDLSKSQYTQAAGGGKDFPQLEGVKINGHWAIIYSRFDIGCALERQMGIDCKGYTYESALKIAANIVFYCTMP